MNLPTLATRHNQPQRIDAEYTARRNLSAMNRNQGGNNRATYVFEPGKRYNLTLYGDFRSLVALSLRRITDTRYFAGKLMHQRFAPLNLGLPYLPSPTAR